MEYSKDEPASVRDLFITSLLSGAAAGTCVDIALFPVDTVKTRLQSSLGLFRSGGFRGLYGGIGPVIIGSAPTSALFFVTYEGTKRIFESHFPAESYRPIIHMFAASISEVVACLIRVPVEVAKQRRQVLSSTDAGKSIGIRLLYRGFWSTVLRDMPFSLVQFPIWEYAKSLWSTYVQRELLPIEGAICGAFAGAVASAVTTPLDVVKTRIMLASKNATSAELTITRMLRLIYRESGVRSLFAGLTPRIIWITAGGFVFFGVYEQAKVWTRSMLGDFQPQALNTNAPAKNVIS